MQTPVTQHLSVSCYPKPWALGAFWVPTCAQPSAPAESHSSQVNWRHQGDSLGAETCQDSPSFSRTRSISPCVLGMAAGSCGQWGAEGSALPGLLSVREILGPWSGGFPLLACLLLSLIAMDSGGHGPTHSPQGPGAWPRRAQMLILHLQPPHPGSVERGRYRGEGIHGITSHSSPTMSHTSPPLGHPHHFGGLPW